MILYIYDDLIIKSQMTCYFLPVKRIIYTFAIIKNQLKQIR